VRRLGVSPGSVFNTTIFHCAVTTGRPYPGPLKAALEDGGICLRPAAEALPRAPQPPSVTRHYFHYSLKTDTEAISDSGPVLNQEESTSVRMAVSARRSWRPALLDAPAPVSGHAP